MGEVVFQMGATSFLSSSGGGGCPMGSIGFDRGFSKKNVGLGECSAMPPTLLWETLKPFIKKGLLEEME